MKLLLIDSRLEDIEIIINSLQNDTKYILLDYYNDTFISLEQKIAALNISKFTNVALMAHSYPDEPTYKMLNNQQTESIVYDVQNADPTLITWNEIINFWNLLVSLYNVQFIDYLGCAILSDPNWNYIIFDQLDGLDVHCPARFRASNNNTGNGDGADWILESDSVNVKDIYFTDGILKWNYSLQNWFFIYDYSYPETVTLAGSVESWGISSQGGSVLFPINVSSFLSSNIKCVLTNDVACMGININNGIVCWGGLGGNINLPTNGINNTLTYNDLNSNLSNFSCGFSSFAVIKNGGVITWGGDSSGGNIVQSNAISELSSNVVKLFSTYGYRIAMKNNGDLYYWGQSPLIVGNIIGADIKSIVTSRNAFVAIQGNGGIIAVGTNANLQFPRDVRPFVSSNIVKVKANERAYAAIDIKGNVIAWGFNTSTTFTAGGNILYPTDVRSQVSSNVIDIFNTRTAFAALKDNGQVVCWGGSTVGGITGVDGGNLSYPNNVTSLVNSNVVHVYGASSSFAALKNDGTVVTWGNPISSNVDYHEPTSHKLNNIVRIYPSHFIEPTGRNLDTFVALTKTGNVVVWGGGSTRESGGNIYLKYNTYQDISANISSNIVDIINDGSYTTCTFLALKNDGTIYSWGNNLSAEKDISLISNVTTLMSTQGSLSVIRSEPGYINTGLYTDKEKIDVLRGFNNRRMVLDTNITITGNIELNKNLVNNKKYKLINYKDTSKNLTYSDVGKRFYIPILDGDRVTIDGNIYTSYSDRLYIEKNGILERLTSNVILFGNEYKLDAGSIIGYNSETLTGASNIVITSILNGFTYNFTYDNKATGYKLYYTPNIVGGIPTELNISSNNGSILGLSSIEYLVSIMSYDDIDEVFSSNISVIPAPTDNIINTMKTLNIYYINKKPDPGPTSSYIQQYTKRLTQKMCNIGNFYRINGLISDAKELNDYINNNP